VCVCVSQIFYWPITMIWHDKFTDFPQKSTSTRSWNIKCLHCCRRHNAWCKEPTPHASHIHAPIFLLPLVPIFWLGCLLRTGAAHGMQDGHCLLRSPQPKRTPPFHQGAGFNQCSHVGRTASKATALVQPRDRGHTVTHSVILVVCSQDGQIHSLWCIAELLPWGWWAPWVPLGNPWTTGRKLQVMVCLHHIDHVDHTCPHALDALTGCLQPSQWPSLQAYIFGPWRPPVRHAQARTRAPQEWAQGSSKAGGRGTWLRSATGMSTVRL